MPQNSSRPRPHACACTSIFYTGCSRLRQAPRCRRRPARVERSGYLGTPGPRYYLRAPWGAREPWGAPGCLGALRETLGNTKMGSRPRGATGSARSPREAPGEHRGALRSPLQSRAGAGRQVEKNTPNSRPKTPSTSTR